MKPTRVLTVVPLTLCLIAASNTLAVADERSPATNLTDLWGRAVDGTDLPELPDIDDITALADLVNLPALPPPPSSDDIKRAIGTAQNSIAGGMSLAGDVAAWLGSPTGDNANRVISTALAGIPDKGQRDYATKLWEEGLAGLNQAQQKMALAEGAAQVAREQFGEYSPHVLAALRQETDTRMALAQQATSDEQSEERDQAQEVFTREGSREVDNASVDTAVKESKKQALKDARKDERETQRAEREAERASERDQSEDLNEPQAPEETLTEEASDTPTTSDTTSSQAPAPTGDSADSSPSSTTEEEPVPEPARTEELEEQNDRGVLGEANLASAQDISDADWQGLKDNLSDIAGDDNVGIAAAPAGAGVGISAGTATEVSYPASIIKIPVAMTALSTLTQEDTVTVEEGDLVDGTGDLTAGEYSVSELVFRMISVSDNTATNVLIAELGGEEEGLSKINDLIDQADGTKVEIDNLMMAENRTSTATANGMTNILKHLWAAAEGTETDILTADQAKPILEAMGHQQNRSKLPGKVDLPDDGTAGIILNKTGEADDVSHDAGYIARDGKVVAVTVLTDLGEQGAEVIGDVGKAIYDWIGTLSGGNTPPAGPSTGAHDDDDAAETPSADDGSETPATPAETATSNEIEQQSGAVSEKQQEAADEYAAAAKEFINANKKTRDAVDTYVEEAYKINKYPNPKTDDRDEAFDQVKESQEEQNDKWETMKKKEEAARQAGFDDDELANWRRDTASQMVIKRDLEADSPDKDSEFNKDEDVRDAYRRLRD